MQKSSRLSRNGSGRRGKPPVIACGVALIRRERQFLIAQRSADDTFGSFWEFPGGKKMAGESFEECVVREVAEELGVKVAVEKKFMELEKKYTNRVMRLHFYLCSHTSGEPRAIECQKVQWTDVMKLKDFKFPPANDVVIKKLMEVVSALGDFSVAAATSK
ncbi:MAG: 8-oxo-dGTP diphosphatase MutT [Candidatus Omnitrophota bacterium]